MRLEKITNIQQYVVGNGSVKIEAKGTGRNPTNKVNVTAYYMGREELTREVTGGIFPFYKWRVNRAVTAAANLLREGTLIAQGVHLPRKIPVFDRAFPQAYEARLNRTENPSK